MEEARDELAGLVASVYGRAKGRIADPAIVLSGGLLTHNAWLRESLIGKLGSDCPGLEPKDPLESAAYGACMLALERLGRA